MENFVYFNPVKILFGQGQIAQIKDEIPNDKKILMLYGGGSIKKNGVYDQAMSALKNHKVIEFGGIEPNPHYETCMQAVEIIKKEKIDFLLSVGGGSVLDGTKFIAAAACFDGEPWDILEKGAEVKRALPLACILTLPATGSEMNCGAVITKAATHDKLVFMSSHVFPKFSVLDPTTTFSLPKKQIANGVIDAFVHVMEQYLTYPQDAKVQDRYAESLLITLMEEGSKALKNPENYSVRANIMWAATCALNGVISCGVANDWSTHFIGHELTAAFGLDHGQTLAVILPAVMQVMKDNKREKILQYAERVLNLTEESESIRIEKAIQLTREFFESLGVKTHLRDYYVSADDMARVLSKLKEHDHVAMGEHQDMTLEISRKVLEAAF